MNKAASTFDSTLTSSCSTSVSRFCDGQSNNNYFANSGILQIEGLATVVEKEKYKCPFNSFVVKLLENNHSHHNLKSIHKRSLSQYIRSNGGSKQTNGGVFTRYDITNEWCSIYKIRHFLNSASDL